MSPASRFDFVSAATFETAFKKQEQQNLVPPDKLQHEDMASTIRQALRNLPAGSVIALEGEWGRGKTDVLARVARDEWGGGDKTLEGGCLWLNPWQYGNADLLQPLVMELGRRAAASKSNKPDVEKIKETVGLILRASVQLGFGYAKLCAPVATPLDEAGKGIDVLLGQLFRPDNSPPAGDPIAAMAASFRELVDLALGAQEKGDSARLLICVDDIDRCLPERQVALLQAFHFLLGAQARASILVAFDPELVREAVHTHYKADNFDVDRFLSKMFHLRVALSSLGGDGAKDLVVSLFDKGPADRENTTSIRQRLNGAWKNSDGVDLADSLTKVLHAADHVNPRLIRRICDRLLIWSLVGNQQRVFDEKVTCEMFFAWMLVSERWTEVRKYLQRYPDKFKSEFLSGMVAVFDHEDSPPDFGEPPRSTPNRGLPENLHELVGSPGFRGLLKLFLRGGGRKEERDELADKLADAWKTVEASLSRGGL